MQSCSAPEGTAMTTSLRMFKFRHRIFPYPSAGITGQTPVAAFQRANSLYYPKSRLTQLQYCFPLLFQAARSPCLLSRTKSSKMKSRQNTHKAKSSPTPTPNKDKPVNSREEKKLTYRTIIRGGYSNNLPTHKYIFKAEYCHFMGNEK